MLCRTVILCGIFLVSCGDDERTSSTLAVSEHAIDQLRDESGHYDARVVASTVFKSEPRQSSEISDPRQKCSVPAGTLLHFAGRPEAAQADHLKVILSGSIYGCQLSHGYFFFPHLASLSHPRGNSMQQILERLHQEVVRRAPGVRAGIGVTRLATGERASVNGSVRNNSASSAKFLWTAAALSKQSVASIRSDAEKTFRVSDNEAAGRLIDKAGGINAVNDFAASLAIPRDGWSLCSWNYGRSRSSSNCSQAAGGRNFFSVDAVLLFLEAVHSGSVLSDSAKTEALRDFARLSSRNGYGGWLGTYLPSSARSDMQHKAGWIPKPIGRNTLNEIGIVSTSRGAYGIAITMEDGDDFAQQTATLEYSSCVIYHHFNGESDPFGHCS